MSDAPWEILHLDLADGAAEVDARETGLLLVLWWRSLPLGTKALLPAETPVRRDQLLALAAQLIADQAAARGEAPPRAGVDGCSHVPLPLSAAAGLPVLAQLHAAAQPSAGGAQRLSVIVCTRERPQMLDACLASLAAQAAPPGQVVVVDNDPAASARAVAEGRPGVTYVHEPRPGLSIARNAGLTAAHGEFVAFTDDDVELHATWTRELIRAFETSGADAVTGLVLPARLDTAAQRAFELDLGGFTSRFTPLMFDGRFLDETREMGPQVWRIGAGANMAFRRASLVGLGGFDERLGAGGVRLLGGQRVLVPHPGGRRTLLLRAARRGLPPPPPGLEGPAQPVPRLHEGPCGRARRPGGPLWDAGRPVPDPPPVAGLFRAHRALGHPDPGRLAPAPPGRRGDRLGPGPAVPRPTRLASADRRAAPRPEGPRRRSGAACLRPRWAPSWRRTPSRTG
ncbi:glycosyltransferase [Phenylobacterium sp. J367]|uniref:glycosyltransferase n=1 Tax=Phenylobacterium sp. J367 TaxID=2898435 RepID=UPI0021507CD7|nr:glycosyltransferase [Phenylobacterium sp. J367]MCR5880655.1 glycosyltransferase [Phenylobacterium sp. J367]